MNFAKSSIKLFSDVEKAINIALAKIKSSKFDHCIGYSIHGSNKEFYFNFSAMKQDQMKIIAELLTKVSKVNPFRKMILNCKEVEDFQADQKNGCAYATEE